MFRSLLTAYCSDTIIVMATNIPRKPKVLNVGFRPPPAGGMANFIVNLEDSSLRGFYDIKGFDTDYPRWMKRIRPFTLLYLPIMYLRYWLTLMIYGPDLIHIHTPSFYSFYKHALLVRIAKERNIPVALHVHGGAFRKFYEGLKKSAQKRIRQELSRPDLLIVLSNEWRIFFMTLIPREYIRVVENGIPVDKFKRNEIKDTGGNQFIFVGEVRKAKGFDELLEAFGNVAKIHTDCHITVVGRGDVEHYTGKSKDLGISENVTFTGEVVGERLIELYRDADIFVLPSHAEGMPLVLLEAMAIGLACIATNVGAIPEVLNSTDIPGGIIIPPMDSKALEKAMLELAGNNDQIKEMGMENRKIIESGFSFDSVAENLRNVYDELLIQNSS